MLFVAASWTAYRVMNRARSIASQRQALRAIGADSAVASSPDLVHRRNKAWARLVGLVEQTGLSLDDSKPDALREKLASAGFSSPDAPRAYTLLRILLIFLLPTLTIGSMLLAGVQFSILGLYFVGAFTAVLGLYIPALVVRIRADRRMTAVTNGFPNCLDLMLVCVEAGLGLEAAFDRVGREMAEAEPLVSQLLISTTLHLRAGASREDALRRLAKDSYVSEIRSFATLVIQSDKLGTSIGTTLRIYASEMRERRRMRAEERAHRLPVIISVPLILCMLPTMLGVLMLPALINVIRHLIPAMTGG
uniref:type II secretion system F family protein n=1 Tax=Altererythrobacter segetis TaxID=1104773 RepID=UPI001FAED261|nr:type II secretion system F family protein [Altererythrobacter segetis]